MREALRSRRTGLLIASLVGAALLWPDSAAAQNHSVAMPALSHRVLPKEFGVADETRTVISATAFYPGGDINYGTLPGLARYCYFCSTVYGEFYATLSLPAGAVIDYIGLNSARRHRRRLWCRALAARPIFRRALCSPAFRSRRTTGTRISPARLGSRSRITSTRSYVLNVEQATNPNRQYFGWVEIWWHRTVGPPPATASFSDVPTSHPFFQFVEALRASGITGGCGDGTIYCPDSPLTRGQMAVFLAKALGLHWPN